MHCRKLEDRCPHEDRDVCPFEYGRFYPSLDDVTSRPTDEVIDWLSARRGAETRRRARRRSGKRIRHWSAGHPPGLRQLPGVGHVVE